MAAVVAACLGGLGGLVIVVSIFGHCASVGWLVAGDLVAWWW